MDGEKPTPEEIEQAYKINEMVDQGKLTSQEAAEIPKEKTTEEAVGETEITAQKQPEKISEVEAVDISPVFRTREELIPRIELPLLGACQEFYDKNIRTTSSSANKKDVEIGEAYIEIDYDTLSAENQRVASELGKVYEVVHGYDETEVEHRVSLRIPVNPESTVEEVKAKAEEIAHRFKKQPMTWAETYTLGDLRVMYGFDPDDETMQIEDFTKEGEYFYDPSTQKFFLSEEQYRKTIESVGENKDFSQS